MYKFGTKRRSKLRQGSIYDVLLLFFTKTNHFSCIFKKVKTKKKKFETILDKTIVHVFTKNVYYH